MFHAILEARVLLAMVTAACVGTWGLLMHSVQTDNPFLALIQLERPFVFSALSYGYATLWFTTPFLAASLVTSLLTIVAYRLPRTTRSCALPRYPQPETRPTPTLVLGESHFARAPGRAPAPAWLTIPQRGLYTGVMVLGAVGSGKTFGCMYPYVQQLLRWRAHDPAQKLGGLVLESRGTSAPRCGASSRTLGVRPTIWRSGSTPASAITRSTTISIRMPWPTPWPAS